MKVLAAFAVALVLAATAAAAPQAPAVTVTGTVQDCAGGKAAAVHAIEVYAFDAARYARIRSALEKMSRLWEQVESVGGEGRFLRQYDDLARQVKAARSAVPHVRTDANGDYKLRALQPGRRYILLAIDLEADGEAYYEYALTGPLKPGTHQFDLWMSPEAQAECRPMLNARLQR